MFFNAKTLTAAALAAATIATPALAEKNKEEVTVATVRYADLDLATEKGQQVLQRRLEGAAREVCGMNDRVSGSQIPNEHARKCYVETLQGFEREIATVAARQAQRG